MPVDQPQQITVLLVDDEENILKALQRLLMDEDFTIETATSGEAGLEKLKALDNVGLIVSDQRMPGMNGAEFLGHSQKLAPLALRILLTGYSDINATIDAINMGGAYRYLSKPWNDDELVSTIRDAVNRYTLIAENKRLNEIIIKQNAELQEWNTNLKERVLQQTTAIRKKSEEVQTTLERIREDYHGVITALSSLVEMRGEEVHHHARKVAELSVNAARELGISGEELETIRIAALLHDIGEIGIPERILTHPPETLDQVDFALYCLHPVRSQMALIHITGLRRTGELIRHHHENFDGSGFPDRLAGEAIPLGSRILAFADQIDRAARTASGNIAETVLARIELGLGTRHDPTLMRVFRKITKYSYFSMSSGVQAIGRAIELELRPDEVKEDMTLSRSLVSGSGMLLLYRGTVLDAAMIKAIRSYYELDPPKQGLFVTTKH
jgi:response regulator RpfG family c-di-GMP phosphodiesterase